MGFLCNHEWRPRTGMDSGSICDICGDLTDKELGRTNSGLLTKELVKKQNKLTCHHQWKMQGGLGTGSQCIHCGLGSSSERPGYGFNPVKSLVELLF